mgnify:CR=1 FL=1
MSFKINDFKKTSRTNAGERLLYPYQIRDDRYTASIGYAIAYYERMVGRLRSEFESETLLEFFGDPRLARGLVACLARTYAWRAQTFEEALGPNAAAQLKRANITTPAALRARLYALANQHYGGVILPHERDEALTRLSEEIKQAAKTPSQHLLTPAQIDQAQDFVGRGGVAHRIPCPVGRCREKRTKDLSLAGHPPGCAAGCLRRWAW